MNITEVLKRINASAQPYIKVAVTDMDGMLRGKLISKEKAISSVEKGFGFCDVIFGWDSTDTLYEKDSVTGWYRGFPDATVTLDVKTLREIPWADHTLFLLGDFEHSLPAICPRTILKSITEQAITLGFEPRFSMEFEWFNFIQNESKRTPISEGMFGYSIVRSSQFHDYWHALFSQLKGFDIHLEGFHTETGPGVLEAAIQVTDILSAADQAALFKTAVKELGSEYGITPSFMAKWNTRYPGCSGHMHQSIWKGDQNLFYNPQGTLTELGEHYLAGLLHCLPYVLPMYAPTINSYKRLIKDTWAPTTISWGHDNRTVAVRYLTGDASMTRFELRVPGADNNPYLSMAASLASGIYGIKNKLKLRLPETRGNAYQDETLTKLPNTLKQATQQMKESPLPSQLFGKPFVDHFIQSREWEVSLYERQVSDWELNRYFEGI